MGTRWRGGHRLHLPRPHRPRQRHDRTGKHRHRQEHAAERIADLGPRHRLLRRRQRPSTPPARAAPTPQTIPPRGGPAPPAARTAPRPPPPPRTPIPGTATIAPTRPPPPASAARATSCTVICAVSIAVPWVTPPAASSHASPSGLSAGPQIAAAIRVSAVNPSPSAGNNAVRPVREISDPVSTEPRLTAHRQRHQQQPRPRRARPAHHRK